MTNHVGAESQKQEDLQGHVIVREPVSKKECFSHITPLEGGLVKAVVDVQRKIIALDADMHVDLEQLLLADGSKQQDIWGINFYPDVNDVEWIEFDSMINIRPRQGNRSRSVEDENLRGQIIDIVNRLFV